MDYISNRLTIPVNISNKDICLKIYHEIEERKIFGSKTVLSYGSYYLMRIFKKFTPFLNIYIRENKRHGPIIRFRYY